MDQIRDAQVISLIERISDHYRTNIANRFIRPALLQLPLDKMTWNHIEAMTEKMEKYRYQGFHLDELYRQIAATARFISATRREIAPTLRHRLNNGGSSGQEKVLRDMAISTFNPNLNLFAQLLCELYSRLVILDTASAKDKRPLYLQVPEFNGLDDLILYG